MTATSDILNNEVLKPLAPLFFLIIAGLVFGFIHWGFMQMHKSTIADAVRGLGAAPLSIEWVPMFFMPKGTATHYRVQMRLHSGQVVTAVCQCSLWAGVYWKDTPWLHAPQIQAVQPRGVSCAACGYPLQTGWRCCPRCGRACA